MVWPFTARNIPSSLAGILASEVEVSLEQNSPKTIILKVQDNGNKIEENSTKGLGTKLLDECAISWKREKSKDLVITSAEFAFSS
jgi:two-component sensor histidine kinase